MFLFPWVITKSKKKKYLKWLRNHVNYGFFTFIIFQLLGSIWSDISNELRGFIAFLSMRSLCASRLGYRLQSLHNQSFRYASVEAFLTLFLPFNFVLDAQVYPLISKTILWNAKRRSEKFFIFCKVFRKWQSQKACNKFDTVAHHNDELIALAKAKRQKFSLNFNVITQEKDLGEKIENSWIRNDKWIGNVINENANGKRSLSFLIN